MPCLFCARSSDGGEAFSRVDLLVLLASLTLLGLVAWPALAHTKPRADLAVCANNLRLVGQGEQLWANDRFDLFPWWVSSTNGQGGTQQHPLQGQVWFNYSVMSNELATPAILVCPSDRSKRVARDWSRSPDGGFLDSNYRDRAVTYFIGLDAYLSTVSLPLPYTAWPLSFPASAALAGDRHVSVDVLTQTCSCGVRVASAVRAPQASRAQWVNALHGTVGNILFVDGQVSLTSTSRVAQAITPALLYSDNGLNHILVPGPTLTAQ